jgi:hypothetical protein
MTWDRVKATGRGTLNFRITIEGMGYEPCTHVDMEQTTADGRVRFAGLDSKGIVLKESVDPGRSEVVEESYTVEIVDTHRTLYATKLFSWQPDGTRYLTVDLDRSSDQLILDSTAGLAADDFVHLGTECVQIVSVDDATTCTVTRAERGTILQAHFAASDSLASQAVQIRRPRHVEGRRTNLYVYGDGDDLQGDGTLIWHGFAKTAGKLMGDGSTWQLTVESEYALFRQDLGADRTEPASVRGIYLPANAPLRLFFRDLTADLVFQTLLSGFWEDNQSLCDEINAFFTGVVLASATDMASITAHTTTDGRWGVRFLTGAGTSTYQILVGGPVDGLLSAIRVAASGDLVSTSLAPFPLAAATEYVLDQSGSAETPPIEGARTVPRGVFGGVNALPPDLGDPGDFDSFPDLAAAPVRRLYLNGFVTTSDEGAAARWGDGIETQHTVVDSDTTLRFIELDEDGRDTAPRGLHLYTRDSLPEFTFERFYGTGNLRVLRTALINNSPDLCNLGGMPLVTGNDLGSWAAADEFTGPLSRRTFLGDSSVKFGEYLMHECRLGSLYPRLDEFSRIDLARLGVPSETSAVDHEITEFARGIEGLPRWEGNALGGINEVILKTRYNRRTDDYEGTVTVRNAASYAERKSPRTLEIEPRSIEQYPREAVELLSSEAVSLFSPVLGLYGHYNVATFEVSLRHFDALVGHVVRFESDTLPNPQTGERGGTFTGTLISRKWDMRAGIGTFRVIVYGRSIKGYAPSCSIDVANSNGAGTAWTIRLLFTDPDGIVTWWEAGDVLSDHFAVGDEIRVYRWNSATSGVVLGVIDSLTDSPAEVEVTFATPFATGSDDWIFEFRQAGDIDADASHQDDYVFEAQATNVVTWGDGDERADELAP